MLRWWLCHVYVCFLVFFVQYFATVGLTLDLHSTVQNLKALLK